MKRLPALSAAQRMDVFSKGSSLLSRMGAAFGGSFADGFPGTGQLSGLAKEAGNQPQNHYQQQ